MFGQSRPATWRPAREFKAFAASKKMLLLSGGKYLHSGSLP
jgi:hypothetical protein